MNGNKIEVTDELLACYIEGKLTENEKAAVELYLSEHKEAMEAVILARYETGLRSCCTFYDHTEKRQMHIWATYRGCVCRNSKASFHGFYME